VSAQDVIAAHRCMGPDLINAESSWVGACTCGWRGTAPVRTRVDWEREHAGHQVDALAAAGFAVVKVPIVAHKGPHDTDRSMLLRAADNLDQGYPAGGQHVSAAIAELIRSAAHAEAGEE